MRKFIIATSLLAVLASCSTTGPITVTKNSIGSKEGIAKRRIWLGLAFGHTDLSLRTAAKNGDITKIATVDYQVKTSFLWLSKTYKVIVTGE